MIEIDGSSGEGGGQIVRTALGLSLVTGKSFHITNIRAGRRKPGLLRQHLTAVRAATEIGNAQNKGAEMGASCLAFHPGTIQPGNYTFSIGTAGSCTLVLQAILPALLVADDTSEVVLEGGTHNPMAPPFDYLQQTFLPLLVKMGAKITATLERPGFFPAGGGRIRIKVTPVKKLLSLELLTRSTLSLSANAQCAELPGHICERELRLVREKLGVPESQTRKIKLTKYGPGNTMSIFVHSEQLTETFTGFGQKNVRAEKVATRAIKQVREYIQSEAPVGPYLADQLLIPLALAGNGCFQTCQPTEHTKTNMEMIEKFLDVNFSVSQTTPKSWKIAVSSGSHSCSLAKQDQSYKEKNR